jgi:hypothetical protein
VSWELLQSLLTGGGVSIGTTKEIISDLTLMLAMWYDVLLWNYLVLRESKGISE